MTDIAEKFLAKKLEDFYGQLYPKAQHDAIVSRFSTITAEQAVALFDRITAEQERKPALAKILLTWEAMQRVTAASSGVSQPIIAGKQPWEHANDLARKQGRDYAEWALANEPAWIQAAQEGWGSIAVKFVHEWAYIQAFLINGGKNWGVEKSTMLASPTNDDQYAARLADMRDALRAARDTNAIMVPCPAWLVDHGRERTLAATRQPVEKYRNASQLIAATAEHLKNPVTPEQPVHENRQVAG